MDQAQSLSFTPMAYWVASWGYVFHKLFRVYYSYFGQIVGKPHHTKVFESYLVNQTYGRSLFSIFVVAWLN